MRFPLSHNFSLRQVISKLSVRGRIAAIAVIPVVGFLANGLAFTGGETEVGNAFESVKSAAVLADTEPRIQGGPGADADGLQGFRGAALRRRGAAVRGRPRARLQQPRCDRRLDRRPAARRHRHGAPGFGRDEAQFRRARARAEGLGLQPHRRHPQTAGRIGGDDRAHDQRRHVVALRLRPDQAPGLAVQHAPLRGAVPAGSASRHLGGVLQGIPRLRRDLEDRRRGSGR